MSALDEPVTFVRPSGFTTWALPREVLARLDDDARRELTEIVNETLVRRDVGNHFAYDDARAVVDAICGGAA